MNCKQPTDNNIYTKGSTVYMHNIKYDKHRNHLPASRGIVDKYIQILTIIKTQFS